MGQNLRKGERLEYLDKNPQVSLQLIKTQPTYILYNQRSCSYTITGNNYYLFHATLFDNVKLNPRTFCTIKIGRAHV